MARDRYERTRATRKQVRESVEMMANANFDAVPSLAVAMGLEPNREDDVKEKHTPGPWKAWPAMKGQGDESGRPMVTDDSGAVGICHVIQRMREPDTLYPKEAEANARLIAAAPELLAALTNLIDACKDLPAFYAAGQPCIELSLARDAVHKAGG